MQCIQRPEEDVLDPLELKSSERVVYILKQWAISPPPSCFLNSFYIKLFCTLIPRLAESVCNPNNSEWVFPFPYNDASICCHMFFYLFVFYNLFWDLYQWAFHLHNYFPSLLLCILISILYIIGRIYIWIFNYYAHVHSFSEKK